MNHDSHVLALVALGAPHWTWVDYGIGAVASAVGAVELLRRTLRDKQNAKRKATFHASTEDHPPRRRHFRKRNR